MNKMRLRKFIVKLPDKIRIYRGKYILYQTARINGVPNGAVIKRQNGKLIYKHTYKNGLKHGKCIDNDVYYEIKEYMYGVLHGVIIRYSRQIIHSSTLWSNSFLLEHTRFVHGIQYLRTIYQNRKNNSIRFFCHDDCIENINTNYEIRILYDKNGCIENKFAVFNNKIHGTFIEYDDKGKIIAYYYNGIASSYRKIQIILNIIKLSILILIIGVYVFY